MSKVRESIVPIAVVAMVVGMMLPLPPTLLDVLLVVNLLSAVALLLSALSVSDPIHLSALPTILLLATLFRLTLNISTTRLILGGGDAGQVISSFGAVVISGSVAVGVVVFLIITLIQFVVIAKGAERIAEVAARFTLDALPGKQMSVDADVRSGLIDIARAREKREELQIESRFYGALDGAMKFVKGDAIAGLIIVAINIIGGLAVGIFSGHLSISEAAQKYMTLTIGDGLVSQIPALLNSLTAGIIVTKVARSEGSSIVNELIRQIAQGRMVRGILCAVSILLGLLPGMPTMPFLLIGGLLLIGRDRRDGNVSTPTRETEFRPQIPPLLSVIISRHGPVDVELVDWSRREVERVRQSIFDQFGILLPRIEVCEGALLEKGLNCRAVVTLRGSPIHSFEVFENCDPRSDSGEGEVYNQLRLAVISHRTELIDDAHTRRVLDFIEGGAAETVAAIIPGMISVTQLTVIFRALIRDQISLRNFDCILQAVAECSAKVVRERQYIEEVRVALNRTIADKYRDQSGTISVIALDPLIDLAFSECESGQQHVDVELARRVLQFVENAPFTVPLIVGRGARALVADTLAARGIDRAVIAYEEIPTDIRLDIRAVLQLESGEVFGGDGQGALCYAQ